MKVGDLVTHFPSNQKGKILKIDYKGWCKVRFLFEDRWVHPRRLNKENERTVLYEVEVDCTSDSTKIVWKLNGETHCEHGPAIWWQDGTYDFYLRGEWVTQEEWEDKTSRSWNLETKRSVKKRE